MIELKVVLTMVWWKCLQERWVTCWLLKLTWDLDHNQNQTSGKADHNVWIHGPNTPERRTSHQKNTQPNSPPWPMWPWRTGHRGVPSDLSAASSSGTSAGANLSWNTKATAPRAALLSVDVGGGRFRWLHRAETSHDVKTAQLHLWIKKRYRLRFRCVWWLTPRTSWKNNPANVGTKWGGGSVAARNVQINKAQSIRPSPWRDIWTC